MKSLNLNQPIFVFYVNVSNKSKESVKNIMINIAKNYNYDNITTWFIPIEGDTKIECIYKPSEQIKKLLDKINSIIDKYNINSPELKTVIREIKIENLLEE